MVYNVYFSPTGGTKRVADILCSGLTSKWTDVDISAETGELAFEGNDVCVVSVPSFSGRVPAIAIQRLKGFKAKGTKAVLVCVYGNRAWEDTLTELQDALEECGFVASCAVAAVAEHSIFRRFASGRPDESDAAQLLDFARSISRVLAENGTEKLKLEGNHGSYKELPRGGPFKPNADENCVSCKFCAEKCPVGAIDMADMRKTDSEKCISCMRCISLCPVGARNLDAEFMKDMENKFSERLSKRKDNHLFI